MLAACGTGGKGHLNASRNLHSLIGQQNRQLPIPVHLISTPVRVIKKGKPRRDKIQFPALLPSSWLRFSLQSRGEAFLGGYTLDAVEAYMGLFEDYWEKFQQAHPEFHLFSRPDFHRTRSRCIPCMIHGDEGRGKCKRPVMVLSIQPLISWKGPSFINTSGCLGMNLEFHRSYTINEARLIYILDIMRSIYTCYM